MDIPHSERSSYPAVIPAERALPASPAQRSIHVPSPYAAGEVIDCVEIHSDSNPSTARRQTAYTIRVDDPAPTKGRWIDIWI